MDHNPEATIGKTQGGMASPTLFNVAVNSIFLHWLSLTVEDKSAIHYGFGVAVGSSIGIFYADDGIIGSWYLEWLQGVINVIIALFVRVGLVASVAKYNTTTCQPGAIRTGISE